VVAETFFNESVLHRFERECVEYIFRKGAIGEQYIKLDQFTVLISNTTKDIYKCRDVFLLFKRIL
jgi:hypothetical protein